MREFSFTTRGGGRTLTLDQVLRAKAELEQLRQAEAEPGVFQGFVFTRERPAIVLDRSQYRRVDPPAALEVRR